MSESGGGSNNPVLAALGSGAQTAGSQAQTNQLLQLIAQILVALQSGGPVIPSSHVQGTSTNDNAPPGFLGEFIESVVTAGSPTTGFSTGVAANVTSISLTPGDWDVEGSIVTIPAGSTTTAGVAGGINTTTGTLPAEEIRFQGDNQSGTASQSVTIPLPRRRISIATNTDVYLVGRANFATSTMAMCGFINARRAR